MSKIKQWLEGQTVPLKHLTCFSACGRMDLVATLALRASKAISERAESDRACFSQPSRYQGDPPLWIWGYEDSESVRTDGPFTYGKPEADIGFSALLHEEQACHIEGSWTSSLLP